MVRNSLRLLHLAKPISARKGARRPVVDRLKLHLSPSRLSLTPVLLVFALAPLLLYVNRPDDLQPRLKYVIDMMLIQVCERLARICKKDFEDTQAS
jgi:hypothetical protein